MKPDQPVTSATLVATVSYALLGRMQGLFLTLFVALSFFAILFNILISQDFVFGTLQSDIVPIGPGQALVSVKDLSGNQVKALVTATETGQLAEGPFAYFAAHGTLAPDDLVAISGNWASLQGTPYLAAQSWVHLPVTQWAAGLTGFVDTLTTSSQSELVSDPRILLGAGLVVALACLVFHTQVLVAGAILATAMVTGLATALVITLKMLDPVLELTPTLAPPASVIAALIGLAAGARAFLPSRHNATLPRALPALMAALPLVVAAQLSLAPPGLAGVLALASGSLAFVLLPEALGVALGALVMAQVASLGLPVTLICFLAGLAVVVAVTRGNPLTSPRWPAAQVPPAEHTGKFHLSSYLPESHDDKEDT